MLSTLALSFGLATPALGRETLVELKDLATEIEADMETADAFEPGIVGDRRRMARMTTDLALDLLEETICANVRTKLGDILKTIKSKLANKSISRDDTCDVMKQTIIPLLQDCSLKPDGDYTLYGGLTADYAYGVKYSRSFGAFIDNAGNEGCFDTECAGIGANGGYGYGAVAGVLYGTGDGDFPGVGLGAEIGGDWGPGIDFAGGRTWPAGVQFVELSAGGGASLALGGLVCTTSTELPDPDDWTTWSYVGQLFGRRMEEEIINEAPEMEDRRLEALEAPARRRFFPDVINVVNDVIDAVQGTHDDVEVTIGPSHSNSKIVEVDQLVTCPMTVTQENWMGGYTYPDTFRVRFAQLTGTTTRILVTRTDSHVGWGMNLRFNCDRVSRRMDLDSFVPTNGRKPTFEKSD